MKFTRMLMCGMALVLLAASARPQTFEAKHFARDGLSFDYLNGWAIFDESNSDAQQLTLRRDDSNAMIKLFVHRGKVDSIHQQEIMLCPSFPFGTGECPDLNLPGRL